MFIYTGNAMLTSHQPIEEIERRHSYCYHTDCYDLENLQLLFLGLQKKKRWIYYFCKDFKIIAENDHLLQVKYSDKCNINHWVEKVIDAGQCSTIVLEKDNVDEVSLMRIRNLCLESGITLVLLEPQ